MDLPNLKYTYTDGRKASDFTVHDGIEARYVQFPDGKGSWYNRQGIAISMEVSQDIESCPSTCTASQESPKSQSPKRKAVKKSEGYATPRTQGQGNRLAQKVPKRCQEQKR